MPIPLRIFTIKGTDIFTQKFAKQKVYILNNNKFTYYITISSEKFYVSEMELVEDTIQETMIEFIKCSQEYTIQKYIHDLNYDTKLIKWYPENNEMLIKFLLDKKEAFFLAEKLLNNLNRLNNINEIQSNIELLYKILNLAEDEHYNSSENITSEINTKHPKKMRVIK